MVIAVDFDGTIVEHAYPEIGKPIPFAIDTLKRLQNEEHQIILWSVREGELLKNAVDYCHERGLDFYAVNSNFPDEESIHDGMTARKLTADLFIDDRNLGGLPDWGIIYQMIHSGQALMPVPSSGIMAQEMPRKKKSWWEKLLS